MVRSKWKRTLLTTFAWAGMAVGQATLAPAAFPAERAGRVMTVQEAGKPGQKCVVVKAWTTLEGTHAYQVQSLATGEMMTIVETSAVTTPNGCHVRAMATRIFHWGNRLTPPEGAPVPPANPSRPVLVERPREVPQTKTVQEVPRPKTVQGPIQRTGWETPAPALPQAPVVSEGPVLAPPATTTSPYAALPMGPLPQKVSSPAPSMGSPYAPSWKQPGTTVFSDHQPIPVEARPTTLNFPPPPALAQKPEPTGPQVNPPSVTGSGSKGETIQYLAKPLIPPMPKAVAQAGFTPSGQAGVPSPGSPAPPGPEEPRVINREFGPPKIVEGPFETPEPAFPGKAKQGTTAPANSRVAQSGPVDVQPAKPGDFRESWGSTSDLGGKPVTQVALPAAGPQKAEPLPAPANPKGTVAAPVMSGGCNIPTPAEAAVANVPGNAPAKAPANNPATAPVAAGQQGPCQPHRPFGLWERLHAWKAGHKKEECECCPPCDCTPCPPCDPSPVPPKAVPGPAPQPVSQPVAVPAPVKKVEVKAPEVKTTTVALPPLPPPMPPSVPPLPPLPVSRVEKSEPVKMEAPKLTKVDPPEPVVILPPLPAPVPSKPVQEPPKPVVAPLPPPKPVAAPLPPAVQNPPLPLGSASVMAASNGVPGPVKYVPVPVVTLPGSTLPPEAKLPAPPPPQMPEPPQPNKGLMTNAFSPPEGSTPPGGPMAMGPGYGYPAPGYNVYPNGYNRPMLPPTPYGPYPPNGPGMYAGRPAYPPMPGGAYAPGPQAYGPNPAYAQVQYQASGGVVQAGYRGPARASQMGPAVPINPLVSSIRPEDPRSVGEMLTMLQDSLYPSQREWAADNLSSCNWRTQPQVVRALIQGASKDPAATVRAGCVRALAQMKVNTAEVVTTVRALKNDSDPRVRDAADQALADLAPGGK